jgi:hypothetical protein
MNVIWNACIEKDKINKKGGNRHQTLKKKKNKKKNKKNFEISLMV